MNSLGYEPKNEFGRRYYFQGKAEGRMELVLKLLELRFGPLPEATQILVRGVQADQLDTRVERMLTAQTLEEALGLLS